ncbi:NodB domain [Trinorchestia longiramus]|nr:NodB domain [Trinorchestia longiramus]
MNIIYVKKIERLVCHCSSAGKYSPVRFCAAQQERSISAGPRRRNRLPAGKSEVLDFSCPEDFGYYQHPTDCTQYYVCVFGGALQESCSGGLVYSHDLQTCDWPRNVVCNVDLSAPVSTVRVTDPRTAAPPSSRSNLTPSVSSNGFAETHRSSVGRKEQLPGPSSSSVNRQGRIISGSNDRAQQDIRGRFQLQESTNRAFSVAPTTTSRTFSFPWTSELCNFDAFNCNVSGLKDGQKRLKRATPDQVDDVTEIKSRQGRYQYDVSISDSSRYPRIVRRGYDHAKTIADDDENFVNFERSESPLNNFKFFHFNDESHDSPKKTHDFFSLDSIEEDLDRGQSLLVDMKVQQKSNILFHRPISGGRRKRPPANKTNKRAVGPSAFSYNAVKTPLRPSYQDHRLATPSEAFKFQSSSRFSNIGSKSGVGANPPPINKFYRGIEESHEVLPASGYSSSSSANPFSKFTINNNPIHLSTGTLVPERPKPMPHEINPFHENRPVHEYTFGPPKKEKDFNQYGGKFSPAPHHRDIHDRPSNHEQLSIPIGHSNQNGKSQHVTDHTTMRSTKLSQPYLPKPDSNTNRYFERTQGHGFSNVAQSPGSYRRDALPKKTSQEFRRPSPTVSSQQQQNLPIYGNDYTLHHNPSETQPFRKGSDDFLHSTPRTRYHEELDYPLSLDDYEYDDYFYGETQPPPSQSYKLSNSDRPDGKYPHFSNLNHEPGFSNLGSKEQKNFTTSRPQFHSVVSNEREPSLPTKFIKTSPPIRNRTPIPQRPNDPRTSNLDAGKELEFSHQPTSSEIPTTARPTRPTRPKIHIPVRRHRKTTSTTITPPPPEPPKTTLKPFTFPPYEKPSPFKGNFRNSQSSKRPIHIPGTARHPELSKLPDSSTTNKQHTTDRRQSLKQQNSRPALPGSAPATSFKDQFDSRPQSSSSFRSPQQQQSSAVTPAPAALDDNFYSDLLNLTDAEYFYLYEDLLLEDYFDGTAGSTTPKPTTRAPIRDRESFSPIRGTDRSSPSSSRSTLSSRSNSVSSNKLTDNRAPLRESFPQTNSIANTFTSQTRDNSVDKGRSSTPNRGPPRGSQSRSQSSTSSSRLNLTDNLLQYQDTDPAPSFSLSSPLHSDLPTSSIVALSDFSSYDEDTDSSATKSFSQNPDRVIRKSGLADSSFQSFSHRAMISSKFHSPSPSSRVSSFPLHQDRNLSKTSSASERRLKLLVPKSLQSSTSLKTSASAIIRPVVPGDVSVTDDIMDDELGGESAVPEELFLTSDEPHDPVDLAAESNVSLATNNTTHTNDSKIKVVAASYTASGDTSNSPFVSDVIDVLPPFSSNRTTAPPSKSKLHPKPVLPRPKPLSSLRTNLKPIVQLSPNASFVRILSRQITDGPSPVQSVKSIKKLRLRPLTVARPVVSTTEHDGVLMTGTTDMILVKNNPILDNNTFNDDYIDAENSPKVEVDNAVDYKPSKKIELLFPKRLRSEDETNVITSFARNSSSTTTVRPTAKAELLNDLSASKKFPVAQISKLSSIRNSLSAVPDSTVSIRPSYRLTSRLSSNHPAAKVQSLTGRQSNDPISKRTRFSPPSISKISERKPLLPRLPIKFPPNPITHDMLRQKLTSDRFTNIRKEPLTESPNKLPLTSTTPRPAPTEEVTEISIDYLENTEIPFDYDKPEYDVDPTRYFDEEYVENEYVGEEYTDGEYIDEITATLTDEAAIISVTDNIEEVSPSTELPKTLSRLSLPFPKRPESTTSSAADLQEGTLQENADDSRKQTSSTFRPIVRPTRPSKVSLPTFSTTEQTDILISTEPVTETSNTKFSVKDPLTRLSNDTLNTTKDHSFDSDKLLMEEADSTNQQHSNITQNKENSKSHPLLASIRSRTPLLNDDNNNNFNNGLDNPYNATTASNDSSKSITPNKKLLNPLLLLKNTFSLRQVEASNNSSSLNSSLSTPSPSFSSKPPAGRLGLVFPTPRSEVAESLRKSSQRSNQGSASVKVDNSRPSRLTLQPVSQIVKNNNHQVTNIWKYPPRRPAPLYPQPTYNTLATKCDRKVCKLPDCNCGGKEVPGGIAPQDVPQMVLLTFDDSVNDLNKELYQDLFETGRTNPNGCPLAATFYISHEWTDYSQVQNLYADGHEIASHSITHSFGEQFSKLKWAKEIAGQREIMAAYGGVRMDDVRGMRAPFLAVGGNKMFEMLYEQNFTYDSSMPVYENRPPSYPYTLDYKLFHDCMIPPCPTNSFPGLWEVPMVMWQDLNGGRCSMGDACTTPPDAEGVYKMLIKNFERHYTTNRAPMGLFYHAAWFTTPHHKEGFIAFLDTISGMPDVWLVTNWQALQWVRDPVPLSQAKSFKPFQCSYPVPHTHLLLTRHSLGFLRLYFIRTYFYSNTYSHYLRISSLCPGEATSLQDAPRLQRVAQGRRALHAHLPEVPRILPVGRQHRRCFSPQRCLDTHYLIDVFCFDPGTTAVTNIVRQLADAQLRTVEFEFVWLAFNVLGIYLGSQQN